MVCWPFFNRIATVALHIQGLLRVKTRIAALRAQVGFRWLRT